MFASEFLCVLCEILFALCGLRFSPFQMAAEIKVLNRKVRKENSAKDAKTLQLGTLPKFST